jgi:hypothetical protein
MHASIADRHLILPDSQTVPLRWENASLRLVECPAPWRVRLLNCIAHFEDLDPAPLVESGASERRGP